jgi:hypothetical protein
VLESSVQEPAEIRQQHALLYVPVWDELDCLAQVSDRCIEARKVRWITLKSQNGGCGEGRQTTRLSRMIVWRGIHDLPPEVDCVIDAGHVTRALSEPHQC